MLRAFYHGTGLEETSAVCAVTFRSLPGGSVLPAPHGRRPPPRTEQERAGPPPAPPGCRLWREPLPALRWRGKLSPNQAQGVIGVQSVRTLVRTSAAAATLLVALAIALLFPGCGGGGGGPVNRTVSGQINTDQFVVPQGETWTVTADLTVTANSVAVHGRLLAAGATTSSVRPANGATPGISIALQSSGNIDIDGQVACGDGPAGSAGGDLELVSSQGNITIASTANIRSGNGGAGAAGAPPGLPGGRGGNITLRVTNGQLTIDAHVGVLHLGNGGAGGAITGSAIAAAAYGQMANAGGNSGGVSVECASLTGLPVTLATGGQFAYTDNRNGYITGGRGGDAGSFPEVATTGTSAIRPRATGHDCGPTTGTNGGSGWLNGGLGQTVAAIGGDGTDGGDGGSATCTGGVGGGIHSVTITIPGWGQSVGWYAFPCYAGPGGHALAIGGNGGSATEGGQSGGKGGAATATGGAGGDAPGGVLGVGMGYGGNGGTGTARGGNGGNGGSNCGTPPGPGGAGGNGGHATATGGNGGGGDQGGNGGNATATGGNGGNGGDGMGPGGGGGAGGAGASAGSGGVGPFADGAPGTASQNPGAVGNAGRQCPAPGASLRQPDLPQPRGLAEVPVGW